jgi:hypothetical protein
MSRPHFIAVADLSSEVIADVRGPMLHKLTINSHDYLVTSRGALARLRSRVARLVRRGGGVLAIRTLAGPKVAVLITPSTQARFENVLGPPELSRRQRRLSRNDVESHYSDFEL